MDERKRMYVGFVVAVLCITGLLESAIAAPPPACQDYRTLRAYDLGYLKGGNIIQQAFSGIDSECMAVVEDTYFKDTVISVLQNLGLPEGASSFVICHYAGYIEGASAALQEIEDYCVGICIEDGNMIGQIATMFYCELATALGGMGMADYITEGVLTTCGEAMVGACEDTFAAETAGYVSLFGDACVDYTGTEEWELAQHNQCVYNPVEEDTETEEVDAGVDSGE